MVLVGFVSALAVRPLLSNPALATVFEGGLFRWETLLALPVLVVILLLVSSRLRGLADDEDEDPRWNAAPPEQGQEAGFESRVDAGGDSDEDSELPDGDSVVDSDEYLTSYLSGHGGTRNREFELERDPPDADLHDHLDHLQEELDGDAHDVELETMEDVAAEHETPLPDRCPHEDCDAPWRERGIIRDYSQNYEILDGREVLCLNCERTVTLEEPVSESASE